MHSRSFPAGRKCRPSRLVHVVSVEYYEAAMALPVLLRNDVVAHGRFDHCSRRFYACAASSLISADWELQRWPPPPRMIGGGQHRGAFVSSLLPNESRVRRSLNQLQALLHLRRPMKLRTSMRVDVESMQNRWLACTPRPCAPTGPRR